MKNRISVIIPVYNVENFIAICLDSLLSQTYENFEIILIDDGSKDESLRICKNYEQKDSRIHVIHQENQGVSAARNAGLEMVTGEYVTFIDPDDYVKHDYLEILHQDLTLHNADIVCCNMVELMDNQVVHINKPRILQKRLLRSAEDIYTAIATRKEYFWNSACMALIKTSWINDCRFRELRFGEDQAFMYDLLTKEPVVYLDTYEGYFYIRHANSATMSQNAFSISRGKDDVAVNEYRYKALPSLSTDIRVGFFQMYAESVHALVYKVAMTDSAQERHENHDYACEKIHECFLQKDWLPKTIKLSLKLYVISPTLYRWMVKIKHGLASAVTRLRG